MKRHWSGAFVLLASVLAFAGEARAHCDGVDGPVVTAARRALDSGDPNPILIWVQPGDEAQIRAAFQEASAVRKLSANAKRLADTWFFETVVRVHRAGEGAPYSGLKPAGRDLGPAIPAADKALESGEVKAVQKLLADAAAAGVRERFEQALALKKFSKGDVAAGRRYVEAYVAFIHHVERVYEASRQTSGAHSEEEGRSGNARHAAEESPR